MATPSYQSVGRLAKAKAREFQLVSKFPLSYRNREDITNLPPGVLIVGSQNVLTNVSERIQIRKGYTVDGAISSVIAPVKSSFQWDTRGNSQRHLRAGFLTSAGNDGKLQYRFVSSTGVVTWVDLLTSLTSTSFNFTSFWDDTEQLRVALMVNGASNIIEWNGASTTFASATATTLTKQGTDTWGASGFYTTANKSIVVGGVTATYTGGEGTTTLTGVSVDFSAVTVGTEIHQSPVTTANSSMTGIPSTFANALISTLNNQVYVGSLTNPKYYISKFGNYKDYSFSSPRTPTEGATGTLDGNLVGFIAQEEFMYITAGKDLWYKTGFTKSADLTTETYDVNRLKTNPQQAAQSQALISKMKNNVIFISGEPTLDELGRLDNIGATTGSIAITPQTNNISDPIKLDFDQYDFTGGSVFYNKYYIYVSIPTEQIVRIYNLITKSWEAPQNLPITSFYTVNGELYGHSAQTSESYKLFTGYADRVYTGFTGFPIDMKAVFSFQNYGTRFSLKKATSMYVEGYINANTTANVSISYELDGCQTVKNFDIVGSDSQIVCLNTSEDSLGKSSLGKIKLGGGGSSSLTGLPPKFRVEKTFSNTNFFECSIAFEVLGVDNRLEIIAFGLNASGASEEPTYIRQ